MITKHCGDHFKVYTNITALCCTTETNIMLYVSYTSTFQKVIFKPEIFTLKVKQGSKAYKNADKTETSLSLILC